MDKFPATEKDLIEAGAAFLGGPVAEPRRIEIAELLFKGALWINENNAPALANLASMYRSKGSAEEARDLALRAISIDPGAWGAWATLGQIYSKLGQFQDAKRCLQTAIGLERNQGALWYLLAGVWEILREYRKAEECYKEAFRVNPQDYQIRFSWGIIKMLQGDYSFGLPMYEDRYKHYSPVFPLGSSTVELSRDILDRKVKHLVIEAEQGTGDLFQMARYASMLAQKFAVRKITLHCQDNLVQIMRRFFWFDKVVGYSEPWAAIQDTVPAMSLPYLSKLLTGTIEHPPASIDMTGLLIGNESAVPVVGFCRKGNPEHPNDRFRSIPELAFSKLQNFIESKYEPVDFNSPTGTWEDTLSKVLKCDLIVTVDTALAHLAGNCGIKTLMLVSAVTDWRWGLEGETTHWYPSIEIFRQDEPLEWEPVVNRVIDKLEIMFP